MELQLGLSLVPSSNNNNSSSSSSSIEGFDLNHLGYEAKCNKEGSIVIGSSNHVLVMSDGLRNADNKMKRRRFSQAFLEEGDDITDHQVVPKTLPLLWNNNRDGGGGREDEDDPFKDHDKNPPSSLVNGDEEEDEVVGWPPVKSWRKRLCCNIAAGRSEIIGNRTVENVCSCGGRVSKFMYVKVKMEGVAIGRKIDLSVYSCFETLVNTLMEMFGKRRDDSEKYKLTYQDREGDWLLAQDVSWRTFIRSVQRLKLVRMSH